MYLRIETDTQAPIVIWLPDGKSPVLCVFDDPYDALGAAKPAGSIEPTADELDGYLAKTDDELRELTF